MIEPLIRRVDEQARRKQYSTIKTTPESIVSTYRNQKARREPCTTGVQGRPVEQHYIFSPKRPRIPWHQKIDWNVVDRMICFGCGMTLGLVGIYILFFAVIPFLRMLVWN